MKLNIDKPCNEDWSSMKIGMISKHCTACEKDVFDFTNKTKEEILTFLIQNQNGSTCGRLKKSQLDFHHEEIEIIINGLRKQKSNRYAFAILSLACLALVSCNQSVSDSSNVTSNSQNNVVVEQVDSTEYSTEINDTLIEEPICVKPDKGNKPIIDSLDNFVLGGIGFIQGDIEIIIEDSISTTYTFVDEMPEFVGGIDSLFSFLEKNLVYPEKEKTSNIQGKVYVNFIIDRYGAVIEPIILRGLTENCDNEVLRVVKLMPKWIPGEHRGKKVKVSYNLPIKFSLD
tara:strand:+ start:1179 stop:2036 length:858 start_codon:yes stop_codon:yes gene_type:complete